MLKLPPFTFLIGPRGCGRTTLAILMAEDDYGTAMCSFDEPVRETVLMVFYPDQLHKGLDLREKDVEELQLPFASITIEAFMANFRRMLTGLNPHMLGDLAKKRVASVIGPSFQRVVYDDTFSPDDVKPFAAAFGQNNCLLVFIERAGKPTAPFLRLFDNLMVPKLLVKNVEGSPKVMLEHMKQMLPGDQSLFPQPDPQGAPEPEPYKPQPTEL